MSIYVVYTGDTNITKSSKMTLKLKLNCFTLYEYTPGVNDSDIDINLTNFFETHSTYDILKDKVFKSENTPLINII